MPAASASMPMPSYGNRNKGGEALLMWQVKEGRIHLGFILNERAEWWGVGRRGVGGGGGGC